MKLDERKKVFPSRSLDFCCEGAWEGRRIPAPTIRFPVRGPLSHNFHSQKARNDSWKVCSSPLLWQRQRARISLENCGKFYSKTPLHMKFAKFLFLRLLMSHLLINNMFFFVIS